MFQGRAGMFPNSLDYTLIIFIVCCYLLSTLRAGPKQLFSFVVIIISFILTGKSYEGVAAAFPREVFPQAFAGAFSFLLTFLAVFGLISLGGRMLEDFFKRLSFGPIDNIVNKGLGIVKGFLLGCMTIVVIMVQYTLDESPVLSESLILPHIMPAVRATAGMLTPADQKLFKQTDKELQQLWYTDSERT